MPTMDKPGGELKEELPDRTRTYDPLGRCTLCHELERRCWTILWRPRHIAVISASGVEAICLID
jgi:hypothetical protein